MAQPTIGQMVSRIRDFLMDTQEGAYRYSDQLILGGLFEGVRTLRAMRPETRYAGTRLVPDSDIPYIVREDTDVSAAMAMEWPFDPRWEQAVRYYACARCFEVDGADTINAQRAADCQQKFAALAAL